MAGPWRVVAGRAWLETQGLNEAKVTRATHLVCATSGGMVPAEEIEQCLAGTRL